MSKSEEIETLYSEMLSGWNNRNADQMSKMFTESGILIGFDGSLMEGRKEMKEQLSGIFADHPTPPFISKIKEIRFTSTDTAVLRAIVGMVPPGKKELSRELNAHQTIVVVHIEGEWKIDMLQNTPAQFHERPDLVEAFTAELTEEIRKA